MRFRSFIIAYALVLAILLFADRRPGSTHTIAIRTWST